jgi:hypothetical protein
MRDASRSSCYGKYFGTRLDSLSRTNLVFKQFLAAIATTVDQQLGKNA